MWLEVGTTTNDLQVVANYFLDCVKQMRGTARVVSAMVWKMSQVSNAFLGVIALTPFQAAKVSCMQS